jgi:glycerol kinase
LQLLEAPSLTNSSHASRSTLTDNRNRTAADEVYANFDIPERVLEEVAS